MKVKHFCWRLSADSWLDTCIAAANMWDWLCRYLCQKCRQRVFKSGDAVCPNTSCGASRREAEPLLVFIAMDLRAQLQRLFASKEWARAVKAHANCPKPEKNKTKEDIIVEVRKATCDASFQLFVTVCPVAKAFGAVAAVAE